MFAPKNLSERLAQVQVDIVESLTAAPSRYETHYDVLMKAYDAIEDANREIMNGSRPPKLVSGSAGSKKPATE